MIKKLIFGTSIGILVAIFAAVLSYLNPFESWHLKIADTLYTKNNPNENIVIIAIDDASVSDDEINSLGRYWDWPRTNHKTVLEKLEEAGAKVVAFDLTFAEESNKINRSQIDELIEDPTKIENYHPFINHPDDMALSESIQKYSNIVFAKNQGEPPLELFTKNQDNVGLVNAMADSDGIMRRIQLADSFALKIAQKYSPTAIDTYEIPLENDQMLINYFADPYKFNHISYKDIYYNDVPDLTDKIAIIGITTPKVQDHQSTPKNSAIAMPGVEIHANAVQTILDQDYLKNQNQVGQILTIIALALIVALLLILLNVWLATGLIVALAAAYYGFAHLSYSKGMILNMVYPFITIAVSYVATLAYKYFAELREKRYIKGAFGRYLSPGVMSEVLKNPKLLHLGGTKRNVTVFFSDIANFTTISESLEPEDLLVLVNDYLGAMTQIVMDLGGTLDKYVGDAIVAYFGAPIDQPNHAKLACEAALRMRMKLMDLHKKWKAEGKPLVDFRIGLNTGYVIVGNVGSEKRFDYTIMGDEVNLGSRLEGANKKYNTHVMISEATKAAAGEEFLTRELDLLRVKGKKKPVKVYELVTRFGEISGEGQELLGKYAKGMELYKARKFKEALGYFNEAVEVYPEDGPSKLYKQRCEVLRDFPPKLDWDGVFTMHSK
ncbi:CHASE2 domain-containing protein [Patescibacteria group bacterium]